jgi:hypothetical protein
MYLIAIYSKYYTEKPETIEVGSRAAVSCVCNALRQSKVSFVAMQGGLTIDHSFFSFRAEEALRLFLETEAEA